MDNKEAMWDMLEEACDRIRPILSDRFYIDDCGIGRNCLEFGIFEYNPMTLYDDKVATFHFYVNEADTKEETIQRFNEEVDDYIRKWKK